jgi:hypothetical protein
VQRGILGHDGLLDDPTKAGILLAQGFDPGGPRHVFSMRHPSASSPILALGRADRLCDSNLGNRAFESHSRYRLIT